MSKLTAKQRRFCDEYLIDLNATQAAIRAGYSPKTARFIANENLTKPNIQCRIQRLMKDRAERTGITQDKVIQELAKIGFADIKDFLSYRTALNVIGTRRGIPVVDAQQIIELKDSSEVDGRCIQEVSLSQKGVLTFKLHDKMKALELIGRHLGMFKDVNINKTVVENPYEGLSTEELRKLADEDDEVINTN